MPNRKSRSATGRTPGVAVGDEQLDHGTEPPQNREDPAEGMAERGPAGQVGANRTPGRGL